MCLCYRTLPIKLSSFVNGRKQAAKIDRHLLKHARSSLFLRQFLEVKATPGRGVNIRKRIPESTISFQRKNFPLVPLIVCNRQLELLPENCYEHGIRLSEVLRYKPIDRQNGAAVDYKILESVDMLNYTRRTVQFLNDNRLFTNNNDTSVKYFSRMDPIIRINNRLSKPNRKGHTLLSDSVLPTEKPVVEKPSENNDKQRDESLELVYETLSNDLPKLFVKPMDYRIYTQDIILVNNIRGYTKEGLLSYVKEIALLRIVGHLKFAYVKLNVLKITAHREDYTVKVRWRISGISGYKVVLNIFSFKFWNIQESLKYAETWYDGFSTFYINTNGKVYKHVVDKVMPDQDVHKIEPKIAPKLALFSRLLNDGNCSFFKKNSLQALFFSK